MQSFVLSNGKYLPQILLTTTLADTNSLCDACSLQHLVGRIFYPSDAEASKHKKYHKPCWLPSWTYARGADTEQLTRAAFASYLGHTCVEQYCSQ